MGTIITETNSVDLSKAIIWKRHEEQLRARVEKESANVAEDIPWEFQGPELEDQELEPVEPPVAITQPSQNAHSPSLDSHTYYQLVQRRLLIPTLSFRGWVKIIINHNQLYLLKLVIEKIIWSLLVYYIYSLSLSLIFYNEFSYLLIQLFLQWVLVLQQCPGIIVIRYFIYWAHIKSISQMTHMRLFYCTIIEKNK